MTKSERSLQCMEESMVKQVWIQHLEEVEAAEVMDRGPEQGGSPL